MVNLCFIVMVSLYINVSGIKNTNKGHWSAFFFFNLDQPFSFSMFVLRKPNVKLKQLLGDCWDHQHLQPAQYHSILHYHHYHHYHYYHHRPFQCNRCHHWSNHFYQSCRHDFSESFGIKRLINEWLLKEWIVRWVTRCLKNVCLLCDIFLGHLV